MKRVVIWLIGSVCVLNLLATPVAAQDATQDAAAALHQLLADEWQQRLEENPLLATANGDHRFDTRLSSVSLADQHRRAKSTEAFLARLQAIDRQQLSPADRISFDVFEWQMTARLSAHGQAGYRLTLTADSGFHTGLARMRHQIPLRTTENFDNYLARLHAIPAHVDQQIELLRDGLKHGMTLPRVVLEGYEEPIAAQLVAKAEDSTFYQPFAELPASVPAGEHERLQRAAASAVMDGAVAGFRRFYDFMVNEYIPGARQTLGAHDMPGGEAYYADRIRFYTTLELTADEIHKIGLDEVARIHDEMKQIIKDLGFEGSFDDFLKFLRTSPRFYAETPEELLKEASYIAKRMDGKLPSLFKTLPRQPYGVEPVPAAIAPKYTAGRYSGAPLNGTRAGFYWVNTYALESRPMYVLEALTLHEAVPGHHLQGALTKELDLPAFRRNLYISAFGEGWGLYSERLGLEAGFYTDPYSDFGRLTYEMWRACRLVVDTGLHAKGWSRQQAIDYLAGNTALSLHEVTTETDRYIAWPGQALSYKLGELEIRRLRAEAEEKLGTRFDIREFHDVMLGNGSLPLKVLRRVIEDWMATYE